MKKQPITGVLSNETKTSDFAKPRLADARIFNFKFWCTRFNVMYPETSFKDIVDKMELGTALIPLQFTGLYDKTGKPIYEGDIIERLYRYEVKFKNGFFYGYHPKGNLSVFEIRNDMTVIGNVFENADLLAR